MFFDVFKGFLRNRIPACLAFFLTSLPSQGALRVQSTLDDGWKFFLGDDSGASAIGFDDAAWRAVTLPHDWSIEGKFDPAAPMGAAGGFLPAGIGWYRLHFDAPEKWAGRKVLVEFEGIYQHAQVFCNGRLLAEHPYGYSGFVVDLTPALKPGGENVLAVRVDNSQQKNSRWYSGSGIYRHVRLTVSDPLHMAPWGVFVTTPSASADAATVQVRTKIQNDRETKESAVVQTTLIGPDGAELGKGEPVEAMPAAGGSCGVDQKIFLKNPPLWSPGSPKMCAAVTRIYVGSELVDEVRTPFGIRHLAWSAAHGLTINGKTVKLNGGCIHHDNGVLGACAFDWAEERKIELLKASGFNAIRTAHNPPSPALLDACDRMGMLVMEEAFDCWTTEKNKYDYSTVFKDWWERDIDAMVLRDRNHPSVVMWSIGNEIPEIFDAKGGEYGPKLADRVRENDATRPVTNGILGWPDNPDKPSPKDAERRKNALLNWDSHDIVGSNYRLYALVAEQGRFPGRAVVETESLPDNPGEHYRRVMDNSFVVGSFVWAAQDHLGESGGARWFYEGEEPVKVSKDGSITPILKHGSDKLYPWHGSNAGDLDILGNRKPMAHWRNITWDAGEKIFLAVRQPSDGRKLVIVPWGWHPTWESWTWPGREGKPMEVEVYSRYDAVRLYLNGKCVEERKPDGLFRAVFTVNYEPGTLKAVAVQDGQEVGDATLVTTGEPTAIRLTLDRREIRADGQGLSFVAVEIVDKDGRLQPNADQLVSFQLTGPGTIAGLGNANLKSDEPYQGSQCHVFHGRALVVLRAGHEAGVLTLKADVEGLAPATAEVKSIR
ncbi:MAG: DUF4982 domain-containing protein [Verrucomicrobiaceae bacterium]|nr:MAG: DUF4982 domain-containing protein [Verrucomicrobiaceae bacterium]